MGDSGYFLGFDLSTQQLKCLATDEDLKIVHSEAVDFDKDLPHYQTVKGVYINGDVVECPVAMWVEALDLLLTRLAHKGFRLDKVKAISGSCQQHGSVYWSSQAGRLLNSMEADKGNLFDQLWPGAFSRPTAPNWQDHSTSAECQEFEESAGGRKELAQLTGSKAHFRFTGPQILKIRKKEPDTYAKTAYISLVSNFLASLFTGSIAPLEEADACGMDLYDIEKHKFVPQLLNLIDHGSSHGDVKSKLMGQPMTCEKPQKVGDIANYFVSKYSFSENCIIYPFTGDNLATICSLPLKKNDVLVSLGTSTTVLLVTDQYHPSPNYHLFIHPTIPNHYMAMICYCNGSLAREKIRDALNQASGVKGSDWALFNEAVLDDKLPTKDEVGIYFPLGEIVPPVEATYKRAKFDLVTGELTKQVDSFATIEHDAKNIVESQALSCRVRIAPLLSDVEIDKTIVGGTLANMEKNIAEFDGTKASVAEYLSKRPSRVFFVGGASKNNAIVEKFASILGATGGNYRLETPNSCALGGCYKALWSYLYCTKRTDDDFDNFLNKQFHWEDVEDISDVDTRQWADITTKICPLSKLESSLE